MLARNDLANVKPHRHPMSRPRAKDKAIAFLQFAVRRLEEVRLSPAGEFGWHQNRPPYLGSRSADKLRWAHVQHQTESLLQVGMDDADEILGCASTFGLRAAARKHVFSDMTFEHVGHQTVHRPACGRNQSQHLAAVGFGLQRSPKRFDLSTNASDPVSQSFLIADGVSHVD